MQRPPSSRRAPDRPSPPRRRVAVEALEGRRLPAAGAFGQLPLAFEANQGQASPPVQFLAHAGGSTLFITPTSATLALPTSATAGTALRMQLVGAAAAPAAAGLGQLPGVTNYLAGSDATGPHLGVASYAAVEERGVYPGVDLTYHGGAGGRLEYDFAVAPGADPGSIRLQFAGQDSATLDAAGDLVLHTAAGDVVEQAPSLYQQAGGARQAVAGRFTLGAAGQVGFAVGAYDKALPLVIDPVLGFSTLIGSGGEADDVIAVDAAGASYLAGDVLATTYPATPGAYHASGSDITTGNLVVSKFNAAGTALIYSAYLGPAQSRGIAVDAAGDAYVTGVANSASFPTTPGAFQTKPSGTMMGDADAYVAKLNPAGSGLVYSTLLGGDGYSNTSGIAVDAAGDAYVTGGTDSAAFPTTPGAYQPTAQPTTSGFEAGQYQEAFVTEFNPAGSGLVYSTYLGGADDMAVGFEIAVDAAGEAVVAGLTSGLSDTFPTTPGAFQTSDASLDDLSLAFVTKLNAGGSRLAYSTYLGGPGAVSTDGLDDPEGAILPAGVAFDPAGNIYVAGTVVSATFPTTTGAYQQAGSSLFLAKIAPGSPGLAYSTLFGGAAPGVLGAYPGNGVAGIAVDAAGDAYVTGQTDSTTFPAVDAFQPTYAGGVADPGVGIAGSDAFVAEFDPAGSGLLFASYLGGSNNDSGNSIALGPDGEIYVAGTTASANFPTTPGAYDRAYDASAGAGSDSVSAADFFLARIIPSVGFAAATARVEARAGSAIVTVTRSGTAAAAATVAVATSGGTAGAGTDYQPISRVLTFAPGVSSVQVAIPILAAAGASGTRTVGLVLSDPTGDLGLGAQATAVLTIVEPTSTTLTLAATPASSTRGGAVTLGAIVIPAAGTAGIPTGTVTFRDGATVLGAAPLDPSGRASIVTAALGVGSDAVTATYDGDATFAGSVGGATEVVAPAPSTTSLSSSAAAAPAGGPIAFTAIVAAPGLGAGEPTGTVVFAIDGVAQTPVALVPSATVPGLAAAQLVVPSLATGPHVVTAAYGGDGSAAASTSAPLAQAVQPPAGPAASTLAPTVIPSILAAGQPFVFFVTASGTTTASGVPTGVAEFRDGDTVVADIPLDARGQAVLYIPALAAGAHAFTVAYSGDAGYGPSAAAIPAFTAAPLPAPTVRAVARAATTGDATAVVVAFAGMLDPTGAQMTSNYRVATPAGRRVRVDAATYDPTTASVALRLAGRLAPRATYRLVIVGTSPAGVRGTDGEFLAGAGRAGTNYTGVIPRAAAVRARTAPAASAHPRGPAAPNDAAR